MNKPNTTLYINGYSQNTKIRFDTFALFTRFPEPASMDSFVYLSHLVSFLSTQAVQAKVFCCPSWLIVWLGLCFRDHLLNIQPLYFFWSFHALIFFDGHD